MMSKVRIVYVSARRVASVRGMSGRCFNVWTDNRCAAGVAAPKRTSLPDLVSTSFGLEREAIANTSHGFQELRARRVAFDLLPQPAHVNVHGPCADGKVVTPNASQENIARVHDPG